MTIAPPPFATDIWPLNDNPVIAGSSLHERQTSNDDKHAPDDASRYANAWVAAADWQALAASPVGTALVTPGGDRLAWRGVVADATLTASDASRIIRFPWDVLELNEQLVNAMTDDLIHGDIHPAAHIEGTIHLGRGSRILPGVVIEGNVIIGDGCKIGPNCYIRGNTSIGNRCHIGQSVEVKNSAIGNDTAIGHLSYVGDSVIGSRVNLGAGTIVSNFRHDGMPHRSLVDGKLIDTGREKFGTAIGDGAHTGIHSAIYPGRKIGAGATTRPNAAMKSDIPDGGQTGD